jgi:hypothetical protein
MTTVVVPLLPALPLAAEPAAPAAPLAVLVTPAAPAVPLYPVCAIGGKLVSSSAGGEPQPAITTNPIPRALKEARQALG